MRVLMMAAAALALAGCSPSAVVTSTPAEPAAFVDAMATGAHVRVKSRSGTFKPEETGHATEVNVTAGKTGEVVRIIGESARIRFDAQTWDEYPPTGATVQLNAFEATIHVSYLEAVK